jgi:pimeloyl-ACP methyl ester carboxylesterase
MSQQTALALPTKRAFLASACAAAIAGLLALIGEYSHRQITHAHRNDFRDDPDRWGMGPAEEVALTSRDGITLHSWLFRSEEAAGSVIVIHGHGGNKHTLLPLGHMLHPRYNVLMLDLRGHGESEGVRTTIGYEERQDVHAAVDFLVREGLGPVGVFGMSMGAATAILAAAEDPRIEVIVADSPYGRLRWAIAQGARLRGYPGPLAPLIATLGCRATALHLRFPLTAFDPVEVVRRIAPRPLLLIHGVDDDVIPVRSAHALYRRAGEPKELWLMDGLKHCQALEVAYEPFKERVVGFFERHLGRRADVSATDDEQATGAAVAG